MRSIKDDMYDEAFRLWDMVPAGTVPGYGSAGSVYRFANGCGHGEYWAYFHDNLFAVNAFDMTFEHAGVMRYRHAEHLSIGYYEAADLIVQSGGSTLRAGAISTYLAEEGAEYVALYQPGSATRATSITISPDYYRDYLQARFGNIPDVRRAFALVDGRTDFPELVALFKQVRAYQGTGMAATLFYEGAVAEALALVIERAAAIEAERRRERAVAVEGGSRGPRRPERPHQRQSRGRPVLRGARTPRVHGADEAEGRVQGGVRHLARGVRRGRAHRARHRAAQLHRRAHRPHRARRGLPQARRVRRSLPPPHRRAPQRLPPPQRLSGGDRGIVEGRASNETRTNVSRETFGRPDADPLRSSGRTTQGEERNVRGSCAAAYVARLALFRIRA